MRASAGLLLFVILAFSSCSVFQKYGIYYKTYQHPTLQFSIEYPRNWDLQEGGMLGSQVGFFSNDKSLFRANANIVVTETDKKTPDEIMQMSIRQLKLILNNYEVITQVKRKVGTLDGFELRGRYIAKEGARIIRTIVGFKGSMEYVITFTCLMEEEKNYTQMINYMIESFTA